MQPTGCRSPPRHRRRGLRSDRLCRVQRIWRPDRRSLRLRPPAAKGREHGLRPSARADRESIMTPTTSEREARELLAREYEREGENAMGYYTRHPDCGVPPQRARAINI